MSLVIRSSIVSVGFMMIKVGLIFAIYVTLSSSFSIEAGWSGGSVAVGPKCSTEFDEVWEEKCETVYEDSCSVSYRQVVYRVYIGINLNWGSS